MAHSMVATEASAAWAAPSRVGPLVSLCKSRATALDVVRDVLLVTYR